MPENIPQPTEFGYVVQEDASAALGKLPTDVQPKVRDVIDELVDNPDAYPARTKPIGTNPSGELMLYTHAEFPLEITYAIDRQNRKLTFLHFAYRLVELQQLFVSYSHTDAKWRDMLQDFLKPLNSNVVVWDDTKIKPGADWLKEIENSMKSARAAVFLVTQKFLASDFISAKELPTLLEKASQDGKVSIIWIAIGPSTVMDSPLGKYQGLHADRPLSTLNKAKREEAMVEVYKAVKKALLGDANTPH